MQLNSVDDIFAWLKPSPDSWQKQLGLEKNLAIQAGVFNTTMPLPAGIKPGDTMQNTSDLNINFSGSNLSPLASSILTKSGLIDTTSPVIPDFLKAATSLNTTTVRPSFPLTAATPWYQNQKTLLLVGGIAAVLAGLFVFTGNKK